MNSNSIKLVHDINANGKTGKLYAGYQYEMKVTRWLDPDSPITVKITPSSDASVRKYPGYMYPDIQYYNGEFEIVFGSLMSNISYKEEMFGDLNGAIELAEQFVREANVRKDLINI